MFSFQAVSEIKDRMDVLTADFSLFVSNLYQSLSSILQSVIPVQSQDNQLNKIRLDVIEIFHRFPTSSELLRPIAIDLMNVLLKVLNDDNEGNAIVAAKIFFDLHKTYRSNLETYVQVGSNKYFFMLSVIFRMHYRVASSRYCHTHI